MWSNILQKKSKNIEKNWKVVDAQFKRFDHIFHNRKLSEFEDDDELSKEEEESEE